jgi:hypothetical protein
VIDLLIIAPPNATLSTQLISPPFAVTAIAWPRVAQGLLRMQSLLASLPVDAIQVMKGVVALAGATWMISATADAQSTGLKLVIANSPIENG